MVSKIAEKFDDQTGRLVLTVGRFSYTVEDYDDTRVTVHKSDGTAMPIFVREVIVKTRATVRQRYARWEEVCDCAYRMANLQARA